MTTDKPMPLLPAARLIAECLPGRWTARAGHLRDGGDAFLTREDGLTLYAWRPTAPRTPDRVSVRYSVPEGMTQFLPYNWSAIRGQYRCSTSTSRRPRNAAAHIARSILGIAGEMQAELTRVAAESSRENIDKAGVLNAVCIHLPDNLRIDEDDYTARFGKIDNVHGTVDVKSDSIIFTVTMPHGHAEKMAEYISTLAWE